MKLETQSTFQLIRFAYSIYNYILRYPTPLNLSYLWNFGFASGIFLSIQLVTGIFLSMHYVANIDYAFLSVENIMRNINYGWLLRYLHSNGASFFFLCVYIHLFRNFFFNSYLPPKQNVWNIGVLILFLMIIAAFTGYVLPWGQMSFWAATVITNLFSAIPIIGNFIVIWLWGGFSINTETLNRFFSFHFLTPFIILILVLFHIILLHEKGSSNKLRITNFFDKLMFNPFFTIKDLFFVIIILDIFFIFVGFYPNYLGHPDNYIPADPLLTPAHIVPEWYFLPFYAILRSIPSKIMGILALFCSIIVLVIFPFFINLSIINRFLNWNIKKFFFNDFNINSAVIENWNNLSFDSIIQDIRLVIQFIWLYRFELLFWFFFFNCLLLGFIGGKPIEYPFLVIGRISSFFYFFYFFYLIKSSNYLPFFVFIQQFIHFLFPFLKTFYYFIDRQVLLLMTSFFESLNNSPVGFKRWF